MNVTARTVLGRVPALSARIPPDLIAPVDHFGQT